MITKNRKRIYDNQHPIKLALTLLLYLKIINQQGLLSWNFETTVPINGQLIRLYNDWHIHNFRTENTSFLVIS